MPYGSFATLKNHMKNWGYLGNPALCHGPSVSWQPYQEHACLVPLCLTYFQRSQTGELDTRLVAIDSPCKGGLQPTVRQKCHALKQWQCFNSWCHINRISNLNWPYHLAPHADRLGSIVCPSFNTCYLISSWIGSTLALSLYFSTSSTHSWQCMPYKQCLDLNWSYIT